MVSIMIKIKKLKQYFTDENYRFLVNSAHGLYQNMQDEQYLKRMFKARMGYELNLDDPKTFSEKLQWLKLHDHKSIYSTMVDKCEAKKYVADIIGEQYIIPTLGVWDRFEDIDFDSLPNQFVLKCTHDSGGIVICRDKSQLNREKARKKINRSLNANYYLVYREWPYKNIRGRVLAEKYMEDESGEELRDYKVLCFNGEPKLIELHQGRYTDHQTQDFYNIKWEKQSISQTGLSNYQITNEVYPKPSTLDLMVDLSRKLAEGIPHIRVDWYSIGDRLYWGELTFYDGSGLDPFDRYEDDLMLGEWIDLPKQPIA